MAKGSENPRSFLRLIFWEGMALAGLLHVHLHPVANNLWAMNFFYNAMFFLAAYPILYLYRWKMAEGCLNMILWPLSFVLSWGLGVSAYLWVTYWLYFFGSTFANSMKNHWFVLGPLFLFIYFPLVQPIWGISKKYFSLGQVFGILFFSGIGGFLGLLVGRFVDEKAGLSTGGYRFLLWLSLILVGMAIGAMAAKRNLKD